MAILTTVQRRWAGSAVDGTGARTISNTESTERIRRDEGLIHIVIDVVVRRESKEGVGDQRLDGDFGHFRV